MSSIIRRVSTSTLFALASLGIASIAVAAPSFTVTDLGSLGGGYSYAYGINNAGQIVGYSALPDGSNSPFLYSNGIMQSLGNLNKVNQPYGINNAGQIVGVGVLPNGSTRAFLYANGIESNLGSNFNAAFDINDAGQIVGVGTLPNGSQTAFLYSNGIESNLGGLGGGFGINDAGQVVGTTGLYTVVGTNGQFVYTYNVLLYSNGSTSNLGTLGRDSSMGLGINNAGAIIGVSQQISSGGVGPSNVFLYSNNEYFDLNAITGLTFSEAFGINDLGQITANDYDLPPIPVPMQLRSPVF